ncbi:MAG TPA: TonB family protein [Blastocatellia bacterium]|nr:TonB family protein [Blastocatellia bacterium]
MTQTILVVITAGLFLCSAAAGVKKLSTPQTEKQKEAVESPELLEANRLSAEVVKLHAEKKYDEAIPLAKRALEIREAKLGREHLLVADAVQNLANLYLQKRRYAEAESLYKRWLSIAEKKFGRDSIRLVGTLDQLGWLNYALGYDNKAEELFQRALSITEKALGPTDHETAQALLRLGQFYERGTYYKKALTSYKRALEIKEAKLGPEHGEVIELLKKCACALKLNGNAKEAEEYEKRTRIGPYDPDAEQGGSTVRAGVIQGTAIKRVQPEYPGAAKQARIQGSVIIEVTVDEYGKVISARPACGPGLLLDAALRAARQWQFTPTLLHGAPVKVIGTITFNFTL